MSADAQPRKRKDKRKKKDDRGDVSDKMPPLGGAGGLAGGVNPGAFTPAAQQQKHASSSADEVMHVYKEGKIGGNPCTKILFFIIMSALAGTISVIIIQHRGSLDSLTKQDTHISSESGWSLDLGLGDWISPFSFGLDEGGDHDEEGHDDHGDEGEGHDDDHGDDEHGEEEGGQDDEHSGEHSEESGGEEGLLSWLGWGGGSSGGEEAGAPEEEDGHEEGGEAEEGVSFAGLGNWFNWGESLGTEETPAESEVEAEDQSSSWFSWGGTTDDAQTKDDDEVQQGETPPEGDDNDVDDDDDDNTQDELADKEDEVEPIQRERRSSQIPRYKHQEDDDDNGKDSEEDKVASGEEEASDDDDADSGEDQDNDDDSKINKSEEDEANNSDEEDDEELIHFLRSLDLEPPRRYRDDAQVKNRRVNDAAQTVRASDAVNKYKHVSNNDDTPFSVDDKENVSDDDEEVPEKRVDVPNRYASTVNDDDDDDDIPMMSTPVDEVNRNENEYPISRKRKSVKQEIDEDDGEELFPEAVEALRLEQQQRGTYSKEQVKKEIVEDKSLGIAEEEQEEEAPFSNNDEPDTAAGEDEAQGASEDRRVEEMLDDIPAPVLVHQTQTASGSPSLTHSGHAHSERSSVTKEKKPADLKPAFLSAATKASEFLAERAAERAAKEETIKQSPPVPSFPPPPSLTPEPSDDEEQLSDNNQYSEGEDEAADEEELVEEEERLEEEEEEEDEEDIEELEGEVSETESPPASDDGSELNLEMSDPEEEELEEEEEPIVVPPVKQHVPPAAAGKKTTSSSERYDTRRPPSSSRDNQRRGGPQAYEYEDITDDYDWAIKEELDLADDEFNRNPSGCLRMYQALEVKHDRSARVRFGKARCLDALAKEANSNRLLELAIQAYRKVLKVALKDKLVLETAQILIKKLRFRGFIDQTIEVHQMLVSRFRDVASHRNEMAISYLMLNDLKEAETVLNNTLALWPKDAVARAHYGLTLKLQGKYKESIKHLEAGLDLDEEGTKDARFYFHLGDAFFRNGQPTNAEKVYEKGVKLGLFRSKYQRSLYNVDRLKAQPWWTLEQTTYSTFFRKLESNWNVIREEGIRAIEHKKGFLDEAESLRDTGDWKQFELFARGTSQVE